MSDLDVLGRRVAQALEHRSGDERVLAKVKARFHQQVGEKRVPERRVWFAFGGGALAAAAAALLMVAFWPKAAPAALTVALHGLAGASAEFVSARTEDQAVDFSDGSQVVVRKGSQLRVSELHPDGATAILERGAAHVSVVHREKTRWTFTAGPYRVHVVGTKFELAWDPDSTGLQVQMEEGVVEVDGPGMARQRVAGNGRLELFADPEAAAAADADEPEAVAARPKVHRKKVAPAPVVAAAAPTPGGSATWRYLAETGDAHGAMAAAEHAGFSSLARSLVQQDVLLLGDTAEKAGKRARAIEAYNAVRERFPGSRPSIEAAMRLGRMFSDGAGDDVTAAKWFERGYREAPNGPLAVDAMGAWLESVSKTDRKTAKIVAQDYLRKFPNGPEFALARELAR